MDKNTKVLRSKSSNAAIPKVDKKAGGKKSRSSGEFNAPVSKKRGVYVEKIFSNLSPLRGNPKKRKTAEAPPRPPPGKKIFLNSVLKILSKSSAATQCQLNPEDDQTMCKSTERIEDEISKKINQAVERQNRLQEVVRRCSTNKIKDKRSPDAEVNLNSKTKKPYKSRVLNDKLCDNCEFKEDVVTVLSTKKNFMQTPSICSGRSNFNSVRWSEMYIEDKKENTERNTEDLLKEIIEGKNKRMTKDLQVVPKTQIEVEEKKDEKELHRFFVDLFKTTMSVNNFKMYESDDMFSKNETKNNLHINESVATKLNIKPESRIESNVMSDFENSSTLGSTVSEKQKDTYEILPQSKFRDPVRKQKKLPQSRSPRRNFMQKNTSQVINRKRSAYKNNNKKKSLINMFKRELTMDYDTFEEPQNLFQALKVMARNKKHRNISYSDEMPKFKTRGDTPCMYRSRKVLALDKKSAKKYKPKNKSFKITMQPLTSTDSEASDKFGKQKGHISFDEESNHSLEVYNEFDDLIPSH